MNEPISALQRIGETMVASEHIFRQAAETKDPVRRLVIAYIGIISAFSTLKTRKRKPFNPMLGETFEIVQNNYRFLAEKV